MSDHLYPTLLANWLAGDLTPEEITTIDAWLAADPARRADLDEMREVWMRTGDMVAAEVIPGDDAVTAQARWAAIQQMIGSRDITVRRGGETLRSEISCVVCAHPPAALG